MPAAIGASDLELFRYKLYGPHGTAGEGPYGDAGQIRQQHQEGHLQLPPVWWPTQALVGDWLVCQQWPLHQGAYAAVAGPTYGDAPQYSYNGDYGEQLTWSGPWTSLETPSSSWKWMPEAQQESGRRGEQLPECLKPQVPQPSRSCQQAPRKASVAIMPGEDEGEESEESGSFSDTSAAPDGRFATGPGQYGYPYSSSEGSEEQGNDYTVEDQSEQDFEVLQKFARRACMAHAFNAYHNDN